MGAALSRNKAIQAAKGKYIAFLDADDKWLPTKLEKQVGFMQKNNIPMSYTAYYIQHPTHTDYCIHQCPTTQNYYQLTRWNRIGCLTVMYDREQIGTIQIPHIDKRNDYALWLTILRKGYTAHGIQEPLAIYRSHNGVSKGNKLAFLKYHYQMFHHILGYNSFMAGVLTIRNSIFYFIYRFIDTQ
jgi:teichuronic acid biosynthesis glycosyltransferase TuaG